MLVFMHSTSYSCPVLLKLEFSLQIFKNYSDIKCHEYPFSGSRVVLLGRTDGQTDMTKLIATFRNFANAPKKETRWTHSTLWNAKACIHICSLQS